MESKIFELFGPAAQHPFFVTLGEVLNRLGKGDALAFIGIVLALAGIVQSNRRWVRMGAAEILTVISSGILVQSLKHLIGRARPWQNMGDFHFIGPHLPQSGFDSFPSGHAFSSFAVAAFLSRYFPKLKIPLYATAGAISIFGRVFYRHHYMTDVICGAALGVFLGAWMAEKFRSWIEKENVQNSDAVESAPVEPGFAWSGKDLFVVILFTVLILFPGLSKPAFWDRDETEYAQACIEMAQNKEWMIPTLEGQPFIEKPIFLYWMVRGSYLQFGQNEFAARFPGALFGLLTVIAVYFLGQILYGGKAGVFSAFILASSILFAGGHRLLLTDPFFLFFTTLSFLFFSLNRSRPSRLNLILSYAAIGFSVLSKGPIGFFPVFVFMLVEKSFVKHAAYSCLSAAIAAPWFLHSFHANSSATSSFFLYDNLSRALKAAEGHSGPLFYHVIVLSVGFLPWSFFLIPALKNRISNDADRTLLLWFSFIFLFFSFTATKLPHYMLPALPPLACILGRFWDRLKEGDGKPFKLPFILTTVLAYLLASAPLALYKFRPVYASPLLVLPFVLFFLGLGSAFYIGQKISIRKSFILVAGSSLVLFLSLSFLALPRAEKFRVMKPMGQALREQTLPESKVYGYFVSEPSLFIYGGRLFPKIEQGTIDDLLNSAESVWVITEEKRLLAENIKTPYRIAERREGFCENAGETTLVLITKS